MKKLLNEKGQFSIIAAALVSIVLVTAIITTYSILRNNPLQERPQILTSIDEVNLAIDRILEFTVGYYSSVLQVTGNVTYARNLAGNYLHSGLENIASTHPGWSPSFQLDYSRITASWFNRTSHSEGFINITYSLHGLGISGVRYTTLAGLKVAVNPSTSSSVIVNISRDGGEPYSKLSKNNFHFYNYNYTDAAWELINNNLSINSITSTDTYSVYSINTPSGIDPSCYMLQVVDPRGIMVSASTFSQYIYTFNWDQELYSSLSQDTIVVEALQNGTLKWLGQSLQLITDGKPIPPIPVKAFHINQTVNGRSREVPFQVEDWGSNYRVPAGLTSNTSIFSSRQMFVFLVNHNVENVILWWDGRDIANQTAYAYTNRYFIGDNPSSRTLTNGMLTLTFSSSGFTATSSIVGSSVNAQARFLRINYERPVYGASPAFVIHHGIIRDIVQQEAEWSSGIPNCPNVYAQILLTLPANATYYTYTLRPIFVDSVQSRTITNLRAIQVTVSGVSDGQQLTENGTAGGYPITSSMVGLFYNFSSSTGWAHHWSEYLSENIGAGIMFSDKANQQLYHFDGIAGQNTGALNVHSSGQVIEFNPVEMVSVSFQYPLDISWHGAVVNFYNTDPIYSDLDNTGLWVMVESPPTVAVSTD
ncbi:MAG: hypothetical protein JSV51_00355 [Candidatus Bathyarchaeota archaeon]|nr:MAG: hypothetical protein JSV51_00355 [Candidatus Bathyarchaeota archaeon]